MPRLKTLMFGFGLIIIYGCASQGRKTLSVFEKEAVTSAELQSAIERIKPVITEDATHEQFRVVKSLRYITKHMENPEKRKLAIQGLLFLSLFSSDGGVRDSSESRLITILNDEDEGLELKSTIIEGKKDTVIGRLVYKKMETSLFSDRVAYKFIYPDIDFREEALNFLIDQFEDLPLDVQLVTVKAFEQILANSPVCLEKTDDDCEEDDAEEQEEWKKVLGQKIKHWANTSCELSEDRISPAVKNALAQLSNDYTEYTESGEAEICPKLNPLQEDIRILAQRSVALPGAYFQVGLDLPAGSSDITRITNIELGFGNKQNFGVITGVNFDEKWMQPHRESYLNIQYRNEKKRAAVGITYTYRLSDLALKDQQVDQVAGADDGESIYVNTKTEAEFYITSTYSIEDWSTLVHLYFGTLSQRLAVQYFLIEPDISIITEGLYRQKLEVDDRITDTSDNEDKKEREKQTEELRNDIMFGVKMTNIRLLGWLMTGNNSKIARQGLIDAKLYYLVQQKKLRFSLTHPF